MSLWGAKMRKRDKTSRRDFIRTGGLATAAGAALVPRTGLQPAGGAPVIRKFTGPDNAIVRENQQPGTPEWQLQFTEFDYPPAWEGYPLIRGLRSIVVEGFASKASVVPGESIDFKISTDKEINVLVDVYRMGFYGGKAGRHMLRLGPFKCKPQPMPSASVQRLRECDWEVTTSLAIPSDWTSGVYLAKLTREEPFPKQSYIVFIVKDYHQADLLFQCSDLDWQAYNKWPGRDSLYDDGTMEVWSYKMDVQVSFNRPYAKYCQILDAPLSCGSGEFLLWEYPFSYWAEMQGYDMKYCSDLDTAFDPRGLNCKAFLSIGHDEYWPRQSYTNLMAARERGVSLGFFCGNSACCDVEMLPSTLDSAANRVFRRKQLFLDEQLLMGTRSYGPGYCDWVVTSPSHWVYEGAGVTAGSAIRGLIGWEFHGTPASIPGLEVVASAPVFPTEGWAGDGIGPAYRQKDQKHSAVVFPGPRGNWVFNAGTIWWAEGLSHPAGHIPARYRIAGPFGPDERVQRITRNVLDRFIRDSKPLPVT